MTSLTNILLESTPLANDVINIIDQYSKPITIQILKDILYQREYYHKYVILEMHGELVPANNPYLLSAHHSIKQENVDFIANSSGNLLFKCRALFIAGKKHYNCHWWRSHAFEFKVGLWNHSNKYQVVVLNGCTYNYNRVIATCDNPIIDAVCDCNNTFQKWCIWGRKMPNQYLEIKEKKQDGKILVYRTNSLYCD